MYSQSVDEMVFCTLKSMDDGEVIHTHRKHACMCAHQSNTNVCSVNEMIVDYALRQGSAIGFQ